MDWVKIIADISAAGMSQKKIAAHVGLSQPWLCALANGQFLDPRWAVGDALLKLHKRVMNRN